MKIIDSSKKESIYKCNLFDYVSENHSEESMRDVFLNMDIALKYIHDHGYCIEVFYPSKIEVIDNKPDHIQFVNLIELSKDESVRRAMIKQDVFNSTLIQVGMYTNTLKSLTPDFLKSNFDEIARFLPEGDVPYYRGVVQRGASAYFSDYALEKMNRDLEQLEKQLNGSEGGTALQKSNGHSLVSATSLSNDKINDDIYKQINGLKDSAFISSLAIPTIVLVSLSLIALLGWVISLI